MVLLCRCAASAYQKPAARATVAAPPPSRGGRTHWLAAGGVSPRALPLSPTRTASAATSPEASSSPRGMVPLPPHDWWMSFSRPNRGSQSRLSPEAQVRLSIPTRAWRACQPRVALLLLLSSACRYLRRRIYGCIVKRSLAPVLGWPQTHGQLLKTSVTFGAGSERASPSQEHSVRPRVGHALGIPASSRGQPNTIKPFSINV